MYGLSGCSKRRNMAATAPWDTGALDIDLLKVTETFFG